MSAVTLSITAATYLFYTHHEYTSPDKIYHKRYPGMNNPPLIYTLVVSLIYMVITVPRIAANALIMSVTPILASAMILIEIMLNLYISHRFAMKLTENTRFPSGIVTSIINFLCPCFPFNLVGIINTLSTIMIVLKLTLLYPIVEYDFLTVSVYKQPDRFRCWHFNDSPTENGTFSVYDSFNRTYNVPLNESKFRTCEKNETPNQRLFEVIIPVSIAILLTCSIPFSFLVSKYINKSKLDALSNKNKSAVNSLKIACSKCCDCICCCKSKKLNVDDYVKDVEEVDASNQKSEHKQPESPATEEQTACINIIMAFLYNIRTMFDDIWKEEESSEYSSIMFCFFCIILHS